MTPENGERDPGPLPLRVASWSSLAAGGLRGAFDSMVGAQVRYSRGIRGGQATQAYGDQPIHPWPASEERAGL